MKKIVIATLASLLCSFVTLAQTSSDSSILLLLNQQIDNYVVANNVISLDKLYADDFVFSHGSGRVEGKQGWFTSVAKGSFLQRQHDSVTVELHTNIAILKGKLSVTKKGTKENSRYHLKYLRVYALRNLQWQMISHITYWEVHEKD